MGIFRDFFVKEKPIFTGITRGIGGFGFGKSAATATGPKTEVTINFVLFGAGGSTSRGPQLGSGKGGRTLATYIIPTSATLEFRAGGRGVITGSSHGGGGGGSSSVHIGTKSGISNALLYAAGGGGAGDNLPGVPVLARGHGNNTPYASSSTGGVSAGLPGQYGGQPAPTAGGGSPGAAGGVAGAGTNPAPTPGGTGGGGEAGGAHRGGFGGPIFGTYFQPGKDTQDATNPADAPGMPGTGQNGNEGGWPDGGWGGGKSGVVEGGGGGGGGYYGGGGGGVNSNEGSGGGGGSGFAASTGTINGVPVVFVSCQMGNSEAGEARTARDADPSGTAPSGVQFGVQDTANALGGFGWIAYRVDGGSWNSIPGENNTPSGSSQEVTVPLAPFA